jgi:hypothetical protein
LTPCERGAVVEQADGKQSFVSLDKEEAKGSQLPD